MLGFTHDYKATPSSSYNKLRKHSHPSFLFYSCTMYLDTIKLLYLPTDAQQSCFKRILKFTLKQLLHVSVQSPSSGSVLFELAKLIVIKIIS